MKNQVIATAFAASLAATGAQAQQTIEMTSSFSANLPILGTAGVDFKDRINAISEEVEFEHFDPGKLVPTLEALDAVSNGSVDAAFATSGYWQGKIPSASLFAAVPFGPEAGEFLGWILYDDGAALWQEMYDQAGYDVKVMPCGVIAPETSGWFKNEINSVADLEGLNMRFFGLGAEVMQRLGVSTSLLAAGDIFPALERGNVTTSLAEGEAVNFAAMVENQEKNGVTIKQWPPEMLDQFEAAWNEVAAELASEDAHFAKVWADLAEYRAGYKVWNQNIYMPRTR